MGLKALELEGLRALVTGAGSGLGRQMALALGEAGANVVLCGRRLEALEETAALFSGDMRAAQCVSVDVTNGDDLSRLRDSAGRVDILVNNAGVSRMQSWETLDVAGWREVMAVNLEAPWRLCQIFAPEMVSRGWGRIINVASLYGVQSGDPRNYPGVDWGLPAYIASKHGLIGLTRYLATTLADKGVCSNAISPGMFPTEANRDRLSADVRNKLAQGTPMRRLGEDDDLQGAVVFLASPAAKFVTGQNVLVDGGWTLW